jgi:hypothetical protein
MPGMGDHDTIRHPSKAADLAEFVAARKKAKRAAPRTNS